MKPYQQSSKESVLVLLAPGFEEDQVVHYTSCLRQNHVHVSLVGLSAQQIKGMNGLNFQPDLSLNQLPDQQNYSLILVLGGYQYISSLMADPRVHQLLGSTLQQDGYVAADETAESIIPYTTAKTVLNGQRFITPNKMNRDEYIQRLISLVKHRPLSS